MKYIKLFEAKYPIKYKVGDYVVCKHPSLTTKNSIYIISTIKKRIGKKPTGYFLFDPILNLTNRFEKEDDILRLATDEELSHLLLIIQANKYNL